MSMIHLQQVGISLDTAYKALDTFRKTDCPLVNVPAAEKLLAEIGDDIRRCQRLIDAHPMYKT